MSVGIVPSRDKLISHVCWYELAGMSFVVLGDGREVKLFSVLDGAISHVADFDFYSSDLL